MQRAAVKGRKGRSRGGGRTDLVFYFFHFY